MFEHLLENYAKLIVRQGVNLQPQQELVISGSIECYQLIRAITKEAYKAKAKDVVVFYSDDEVTKMRYLNCDLEHFQNVPEYIVALRNEYAKKHAAVISITSEDPQAMIDVDPLKIQAYNRAIHQQCKLFYDHLDLGIDRWCIVGAPSQGWANKVFADMSDKEAMQALWQAIFKVCRCYEDDVVEAWNKHRHSFERRVQILNDQRIQSIHYHNSLGTDLTVGMNQDYLFAGGGSYTSDGIYSFPNIPTEEIFTSPQKDAVNGIVYNALPLNYNGHIVDDFYIVFKDGRIVDYDAQVGYDVLKSIIETDEGSHYLGEIAFVPYDSPIRNTGILFYNTLFDENASCHLAIGKGFSECIKNGLSMNKEELLAKGVNDSLTHVDFMIGTSDLSIVATLENGEEFVIFKDGNYHF